MGQNQNQPNRNRGPFLTLPEVASTLGMKNKPAPMLPSAAIQAGLRINDEQLHCNRFQWGGLPLGLDANLIERILYYRGTGVMVFLKGQNKWVFLPYVLNGSLDYYGRFNTISPLPFTGSEDGPKNIEDARKSKDPMTRVLAEQTYDVLYEPIDTENITEDIFKGTAVVLWDYTKQFSQIIVPKYKLTEPIIQYESKLIPYMNTALANSTGVGGVRVGGQEDQATVEEFSQSVEFAAETGRKWIPLTAKMEIQELTSGQVAKAEEFMLAMQSLENYRMGIHGISNSGLFEKKSHTTDLENSINIGTSNLVLDDALYQRQLFCRIANSLWGLSMWVIPAETAIGMDYNGDGMQAAIPDTGSGPMVEPTANKEVSNNG